MSLSLQKIPLFSLNGYEGLQALQHVSLQGKVKVFMQAICAHMPTYCSKYTVHFQKFICFAFYFATRASVNGKQLVKSI